MMEEHKADPVEKKLAQCKRKLLNHVSRIEDTRRSISTYRKKTWTTVKETNMHIQPWGRNRSFIGLTSRPEENTPVVAMVLILRNTTVYHNSERLLYYVCI